jgi:hypothetical protein
MEARPDRSHQSEQNATGDHEIRCSPAGYLRLISETDAAPDHRAVPDPNDVELLARALTLAALVAGAIQYSLLIRRRIARRTDAVLIESQEAGLRGLVRVMLVDG